METRKRFNKKTFNCCTFFDARVVLFNLSITVINIFCVCHPRGLGNEG